MSDCNAASLLCLSKGWEGAVLHEHPPAEHSRSKSESDTQRSEVTAGVTGLEGAVNTQGLFVLELKAMILPSRCGYPCMRMLMKRTWVCERISSVISVDFPEHPEP